LLQPGLGPGTPVAGPVFKHSVEMTLVLSHLACMSMPIIYQRPEDELVLDANAASFVLRFWPNCQSCIEGCTPYLMSLKAETTLLKLYDKKM